MAFATFHQGAGHLTRPPWLKHQNRMHIKRFGDQGSGRYGWLEGERGSCTGKLVSASGFWGHQSGPVEQDGPHQGEEPGQH